MPSTPDPDATSPPASAPASGPLPADPRAADPEVSFVLSTLPPTEPTDPSGSAAGPPAPEPTAPNSTAAGPVADGPPVREPAGRVEFVHRSWPADPAQLSVIRRELTAWLAPLQLSDDETAQIVLAVDEAAANAIRHAYGPGGSGVVDLTLWTEPGTLCVEVVDHGHWRPPARPAARGEAGDGGSVDGGRGLTLMSSMADAVLIHYDERGSRVLLRHRVPGAAGWLDDPAEDRSTDY